VPAIEHVVAAAVQVVGFGVGALESIARMLLDGVVGALAGGVVVAITQLVKRLRRRATR
jgi:predicted DNA repair protein MutK